MILLDADILLVDIRYKRDARFTTNSQLLSRLRSDTIPIGITLQALLELAGILSFNIPASDVPQLPHYLHFQYGLTILPDPSRHSNYAGCTVLELVAQIATKMGLGDAVQAVQIARYAANAECLLSWNAKHFVGKLVIPVFTPAEWLASRNSNP